MQPGLLPLPLIDIDPSDFPVGFLESVWSALDVFVARFVGLGFIFAVHKESIPGNAAAQRRVEHETHVPELGSRAIRRIADWKVPVRQGPLLRIRHDPFRLIRFTRRPDGVHQVVGNGSVRREHPRPNVPVDGIPLQRKNPPALLVEGPAEGSAPRVDGDAALVEPLVGVVHVTIPGLPHGRVGDSRLLVRNPHRRIPRPGHGALRDVVHVAPLAGVEGSLGFRLKVDALDDIDLSIDRPIGLVGQPKGGPHPASRRHVADVDDEQSPVESFLALQSDGFSRACIGGSRLEVQEGFFRVGVGRFFVLVGQSPPTQCVQLVDLVADFGNGNALGSFLVHVRYVSIRSHRIRSFVKRVISKKVFPLLSLYQFIRTHRLVRRTHELCPHRERRDHQPEC
mmetsp:Transcript_20569/g.57076  ORF Transcript_20569/g.57076 Transcript_20569/m.57076 type:complete len:396 (+) Transcript_20569:243-1430(+)